MRKHIFYLIGAMLLAFSFASCSKKDNCDPNDKNSPCYAGLPEGNKLLLVEQTKNGKLELAFEYNDQNRVIVKHTHPGDGSGVISSYFTYNKKGLLIAVDHKKGSKNIYREEYTYGNEDNPTSGAWIFPNEKPTIIQYSYSKNKVIEKTKASTGAETTNTYTFNDKGNPLMIELFGGDIMISKQEFGDYDNKPYCFTNYPWKWKLNSVNNTQSYKLTTQVSGTNITLDQVWKYTYNDMGYPTKIEIFDRLSKTLTETLTLTYKAAK